MDEAPAQPGPRPSRARTGRLLAAGVAGVEALVAAGGAVTALLAGVQGGSLVLAAAVGGVAAGAAYLLLEAARGFLRGRRWPTGIFLTVQVLVALVALSLGGRALLTFADNPGIGVVTVVALALAVAGLVAVSMLATDRAGAADAEEPPPVF
ncbi:hypothetical protein [Aquipuribacter hungaricus]|uniref:ATP synthase protein I n=1 Tax=Aquipuribacter hungaricus TaxID=545624 RepID=A0ABV7WIG0_9MICO